MKNQTKPFNNEALKKLLEKTAKKTVEACEKSDIEAIFEDLINYPFRIKYSYKMSGFFALLLAFFVYFFIFVYENIVFSIIFAIAFVIVVSVIFYKKSTITGIKNNLIYATMSILYKSKDLDENFLNLTLHKFKDFYRGNYSRELQSGVEVEFNSQFGKVRVYVVQLHYVDEYTVVDKEGNVEKKYKHHKRQGVIFPKLSQTKSIYIGEENFTTGFRQTFKPASRKFRRFFSTIAGEDEFALAKFLEPEVVLMLEKAAQKLHKFTLEFNSDGEFLISKYGDTILKTDTINSLEFPQKLRDELFNETSFKNLDFILALANSLIRQMNY